MSELIASKIASVRRKHGTVAMARGTFAFVGAAVLLLALTMILDWVWELPHGVRLGLLLADAAVLSALIFEATIRPLIWGPDEDEIALMVEREVPSLSMRLIASVQFSRPGSVPAGASLQLVRATIFQTERLIESIHFPDVIRTDRLARTAALCSLILCLGLGSFVWTHEVSGDLLKRAFLSDIPVPRKTRIRVLHGDRVIAVGDPVSLQAMASGIIPPEGTVEVYYASGRRLSYTIEPAPEDTRKFVRDIDNVQESFSYRFRLNDGTSAWYSVRAVHRPALAAVEFTMTYPPYLKLPPEHKSPGDLSLLVGSKLSISLKASKTLKSAGVRLVGCDREAPLNVSGDGKDESSGVVDVPVKGLTGLAFHLQDQEGIWSKNETVFPVELVPDREPTLRITWPDRRDDTATSVAKVLLAFEATDDYGIAKVILWRKIGDDENVKATPTELDLSDIRGDELRRLVRRYQFDLADLKVAEGTVVEYWLEVQDGNTVTGPGRSVSEHYKVKIVSELEKKAELMNRLNEQLGTIDFVTQDQEKLNQTLGKLILEKK